MRPLITSRLPSHSTISAPSPRKNDMLGKNRPWSAISRRLRRRYSAFDSRKRSSSRASWPIGAHDADAGQRFLHDRADVGQLRLDLLEPLVDGAAEILHRDRHERQRNQRDSSVSRASIDSISVSATTNVSSVLDRIHDRGPDHHAHGVQIVGGARHQVAGPVRLEDSRAAASPGARRSRSACRTRCARDAPMRIRRMQERKHAADEADRRAAAPPYSTSFARVTPVVRSSIA